MCCSPRLSVGEASVRGGLTLLTKAARVAAAGMDMVLMGSVMGGD